MPPLQQVIPARKQHHEPEQQTTPVHPVGCHRDRTREQREDQDGQQPAEGSDIDGRPGFAERPLAVREWLAFEAFEEQAADGDAVGG
jgi:hypothetical protein